MSLVAFAALLSCTAVLSGVSAQNGIVSTPLVDDQFPYTALPPQAEPYDQIRGAQYGYNQCNSTTEGPDSKCQTLIVNAIDDWCLWSSPTPEESIGNTEAYEVAWCSKTGHGTRIMPPDTLQGVSVYISPDYVMIIAFLDQTKVNLAANDSGGELDPHGADLGGNPLGALVYSTYWPAASDNFAPGANPAANSYTQMIEWTEFIGNGFMCLKICNPATANANNVGLCNNIYDEIGINYNCPNAAQNGTFEVCHSDSMSPVGVYVVDGVTSTYQQPANGPVGTLPYTPSIPATSQCTTYQSSALYTDLAAPSSSASSGSAASSPTGSGSGTSSRSGSGSSPTETGSGANANGAALMRVDAIATLASGVLAIVFLL